MWGLDKISLLVHAIDKLDIRYIKLTNIMTYHTGISPTAEILDGHRIDLLLLDQVGDAVMPTIMG